MATPGAVDGQQPQEPSQLHSQQIHDFLEAKGLQPMKTSGTGMALKLLSLDNSSKSLTRYAGALCGLYAISAAIADATNPDVVCDIQRKFRENDVRLQLMALMKSEPYKDWNVASQQANANATAYNDDMFGSTNNWLSEQQITKLIELWCSDNGIAEFSVIIAEPKRANLDSLGEEVPANWRFSPVNNNPAVSSLEAHVFAIYHPNALHWEPLTRVLNEDDVSKNGELIDPSDRKYHWDPRFHQSLPSFIEAHCEPDHDCQALRKRADAIKSGLSQEELEKLQEKQALDEEKAKKQLQKREAKQKLETEMVELKQRKKLLQDALLQGPPPHRAKTINQQLNDWRTEYKALRKIVRESNKSMDKKVAAYEKDVRAYDRQVKEAVTTHYKELREYAEKQSANMVGDEDYPILDTRDCHVPTPPSSDVSDIELSSVDEISDDTDDESCDSSESSVSSDEEEEVVFVDGAYQFPDGFKVFAGHPTYEQVAEELELVKDGKTPILAIPDNVPLVQMHNPKRASSAYKDSRKAFMTPCQLKAADDTFMPKLDLAKQARRTWDGANLQLSLNSRALSPSLRLTISCYRNKEDPAATAYVDYYFPEIHRRDPSAVDGKYDKVRGVTDITYAFSDDGKSCDIAWTSYAGVPTNLPFVSTRNNFKVRQSETQLIDELLGIANPDDSGALIQLRVPLSDEEQTARTTGTMDDFKLGSFLMSLPGARNVGKTQLRPNVHAEEQPSAKPSDAMSSNLLHPYMRSSGHPRVQAGNMINPKLLIKQGHPYQPLRATSVWVDERQAEVSLGYGSHIQQLETDNILKALARNTHHGRVIANSDQVFVAVKWSIRPQLGFASEVFRLDEGTDVSLTIFSESSEFPFKAECLVIANTYGLGQCNVLLLVQNRDRAYFKALPVEWERDLDVGNVDDVKVQLEIQENVSVSRLQLNTVSKIYDGTLVDGTKGRLFPTLLSRGFTQQRPAPQNPFQIVNIGEKQQTKINNSFKKFIKSGPFNRAQQNALKAMTSMHGGMELIRGPGGTGKTHLLLALTDWIIKNIPRAKVFIGSHNNEVLDHIATEYKEKYCQNGKDPLRTSAASLSGPKTFVNEDEVKAARAEAAEAAGKTTKTFEVEESKDLVLLEAFLRLSTKHSTRGRRLVDMTIEKKVWDYVHAPDTKPLMKAFVKVTEGVALKDGPDEDMVLAFKSYSTKLRSVPLGARKAGSSDEYEWSDDEKRRLRQAYSHIRDHVVANEDVLVGTVYTTASRDFAKFGENADRIFYFLDEAPTVQEASALIPLALPEWAHLIVAFVMLGDLAQLPPMVPGDKFNLHYAQLKMSLYERLVRLGFTQSMLTEQRRMHHLIASPANQIFYDNKLVATGTNAWSLPEGFEQVAKQAFGLAADAPTKLSEQQQRLAWISVEGSHVRTSTDSASKANYETFAHGCKILLLLHSLLGEDMSKLVVVMSPYKRQIQLYEHWLHERREQDGWTDAHVPECLTVDKSQGRQMRVQLLDMVVTDTNSMGFMGDSRRACVAFTRAMDVQWCIGGSMNEEPSHRQSSKMADYDDIDGPGRKMHAVRQYKQLISRTNCEQALPEEQIQRPELKDIAEDLREPGDEEIVEENGDDGGSEAADGNEGGDGGFEADDGNEGGGGGFGAEAASPAGGW